MKSDLAEFCARVLADQEVLPRARTIARTVAESLPDTAVNVYLFARQEGTEVWAPEGRRGRQRRQGLQCQGGMGHSMSFAFQRAPLIFLRR